MNEKGEFDPNLAAQEVQDNLREAARKYIFMCYDSGPCSSSLFKKK